MGNKLRYAALYKGISSNHRTDPDWSKFFLIKRSDLLTLRQMLSSGSLFRFTPPSEHDAKAVLSLISSVVIDRIEVTGGPGSGISSSASVVVLGYLSSACGTGVGTEVIFFILAVGNIKTHRDLVNWKNIRTFFAFNELGPLWLTHCRCP